MNDSITAKIRKYLAPNIPYVFIGWVFLKLSTAFRMADGANIGEQLIRYNMDINRELERKQREFNLIQ